MKRSNIKRISSDPKKKAIVALDRALSNLVRLHYLPIGCFTCGRVLDLNGSDCGHFVKRERMATRFDLRNLGLQCQQDNRFKGGMEWEFGKMLNKIWGNGTADQLKKLAKKNRTWTIAELGLLRDAAKKGWLVYLQIYSDVLSSTPFTLKDNGLKLPKLPLPDESIHVTW
jgi:hypothetical protein